MTTAPSRAGDAAAVRAARTWLFVPGDRPERFDKAAGAGADLVVLDLEDAVTADAKGAARDNIVGWLLAGGRGVVRINGADTAEHEADLRALARLTVETRAGSSGLVGVIVPMAARADSLAAIHQTLGVPLVALIETAAGVLDARELAGVSGVERLAFGAIDFSLDIDAVEQPDTLRYARSHLVLASRAAGLDGPIDGVTVDLSSAEPTAADARAGRALGMGGKLCVHPMQMAPTAEAFAPTPDEITWAEGVLAAVAAAQADGSTTGAIRFEGQMIDEPVLERARRILSRVADEPKPTLARTPHRGEGGS